MPAEPGQSLLHYRLIEKIGEGGMGEVWKALDTRLDREVAVKLLPEAFARDPRRLARFEQEAKAVAALSHPNIVTLHSIEEDGKRRFITMELVRGRPLRKLIPPGGMPLSELLGVAIPLIDAVGRAHEHGITHRDLKPDNVMVDERGQVRVLDFGLAKVAAPAAFAEDAPAADPTATRTAEGTVLGTVSYMSPEQAEGKTADARSDVFSLGVMLYEMATGQRPFRGDTGMSVLSAIIKDEPPTLAEARPALPRDLGRIVRRALEKDPERRYQRAQSLLVELEQLAREGTVSPAALAEAAPGPPVRKIVVGLVAVGLVAAIAAVVLWGGREAAPEAPAAGAASAARTSVAVLPFDNVGGGPDNEYFSAGMTDELINALGRVEGLRVAARTTVFTLKDKGLTVQEIAERLGVSHVLEGSVRKAGDELRITAQLVDAGAGFDIAWSGSYDGAFAEVFSVQETIARSIVENLQLRLGRGQARLLVDRPTTDLEAYNLFLRARFHQSHRTLESLHRSIELYREALERDPAYADAWAGLALSHLFLANMYDPPRERMPEAEAAARRAIELRPGHADAYIVLGAKSFVYDWDWASARRRFERAIELAPEDAMGYAFYGQFLVTQREIDEGVRAALRAEQLDPMSLSNKWEIWVALFMAREYEQAIEVCDRGLELEPDLPWLLGTRGATHTMLGDFERAIADAERAVALEDSVQNLEFLLYAYAAAGQPERARAGLERLLARVEERYTCPYEVAMVYVGLDELDTAMDWFEKAYDARSDCWAFGNVDPRLDHLRTGDPRFVDLLRRVGHPVD